MCRQLTGGSFVNHPGCAERLVPWMMEYHILPHPDGGWQIVRNRVCVGIYDGRDDALAHACTLARDGSVSDVQPGWTLVLHEGQTPRRVSVPY